MYISFGKRVIAWLVDTLVIQFIMQVFLIGFLNLRSLYYDFILSQSDRVDIEELGGIFESGVYFKFAAVLGLLLSWLYYASMESSKLQATVGKLAIGSIVVGEMNERITFGKASGRFFGKIISSLILYIGYLMVIFTEQRQGLHDKMAKAYVVDKDQLAAYLTTTEKNMDEVTKIA
ncbi:RDD family protein [Fontibacillus phaseoli]|uniref:RDD family protein n=1 Tax=Fontibacillus phaseoli TaxID=1416533 RepID=A0A369BHJ0_9BACL|nr:RDD family protein [Fontibacillus phaseoli]RCX20735.1 RDD family protein [Fontibacillus phaseoli]